MPRLRPQQRQELHPGDCACCSTPSLLPPGASQTLSELDFTRSAAAAAASGDLERLRRLVAKDAASAVAASRRGAAPASASSSDGFTPLHFAVRAARGNAAAAVSLLLAAGADPNAETTAGRATPLHRSAFAGDAGVTRMLLEAGADASRADADGETAAHKAAGQGHEEVMKMLLEAAPSTSEVRDARKKRTPWETLREKQNEKQREANEAS